MTYIIGQTVTYIIGQTVTYIIGQTVTYIIGQTVTYIITSITARPIRLAAILAIMSVSTFITTVILYIIRLL